jgi:predicted ATPase
MVMKMNSNLYIEKVMFRFDKPVTFIIGENGTGKSTLLEAIAIRAGFNAEGFYNVATQVDDLYLK